MANLVPEVDIELDKQRKLIYDLNAQCKFQETVGKSIFEVVVPATPIEVRALLWAGLLRDDPSLTLEQVGAMVPFITAQLSEQIFTALSGSLPESKGEAAGENPTDPTG